MIAIGFAKPFRPNRRPHSTQKPHANPRAPTSARQGARHIPRKSWEVHRGRLCTYKEDYIDCPGSKMRFIVLAEHDIEVC